MTDLISGQTEVRGRTSEGTTARKVTGKSQEPMTLNNTGEKQKQNAADTTKDMIVHTKNPGIDIHAAEVIREIVTVADSVGQEGVWGKYTWFS